MKPWHGYVISMVVITTIVYELQVDGAFYIFLINAVIGGIVLAINRFIKRTKHFTSTKIKLGKSDVKLIEKP